MLILIMAGCDSNILTIEDLAQKTPATTINVDIAETFPSPSKDKGIELEINNELVSIIGISYQGGADSKMKEVLYIPLMAQNRVMMPKAFSF